MSVAQIRIRNGVQEYIEGKTPVPTDTQEPAFEILWDTDVDGPLSAELIGQVGGLMRVNDQLEFDQDTRDADDAAKLTIASEQLASVQEATKLQAIKALADGTPITLIQEGFAAFVLSKLNPLLVAAGRQPATIPELKTFLETFIEAR